MKLYNSKMSCRLFIDLGTKNIKYLLANNDFNILESGRVLNDGIEFGEVVDYIKCSKAISDLISQINKDFVINGVSVSIGASDIIGFNSHSASSIASACVSNEDINKAMDLVKCLPIAPELCILHIITQEFFVDGNKSEGNPIGLEGSRLDADVHVVTYKRKALTNLVNALKHSKLDVGDIVYSPLAAGNIVLTDSEKENGVILLDIGASITNIIAYSDGCIKYTASIPVGGDNITRDISLSLNTDFNTAEDLKLNWGAVCDSGTDDDVKINIKADSLYKDILISASSLSFVIKPRIEEIIEMSLEGIINANILNLFSSGLVLIGGSSNIYGLVDLIERRFNIEARLGYIEDDGYKYSSSLVPVFGLLLESHNKYLETHAINTGILTKVVQRFKSWFSINL